MANGDTIHEVKELLAKGGEIRTEAALRLSLELQSQMFEKLTALEARLSGLEKRQGDLEKNITTLQNNSIVLWIVKHPKAAVAAAVGLIFVVSELSAHVDVSEIFMHVFGLK